MVKFADGGNKKKVPYAALQWLGREQDVSVLLNFFTKQLNIFFFTKLFMRSSPTEKLKPEKFVTPHCKYYCLISASEVSKAQDTAAEVVREEPLNKKRGF